ncbi:hypothetical protein X747_24745 [Mesorhizobium sp. LNJC384A00]|uniref:hypothetical protein n=1 Tax=Mesorhizobium sp. LNJC384A00 TaxID=1287268 RepID=UPI0003CED784|nr:hypothetical protein [Mesorhizobium sp. LNJC384A00]ESY37777.1 hypothetical protein X747_24745 [Mesorhizobium sp. LNJC384A00]
MDLIKHLETARAVMETSFHLQSRSMTGTAAFRSHMDHTRQAIQESRELLKRLRQRYREDMAQVLEDEDDLAPMRVSGFDADVLRSAFQNLVRDADVPECQWRVVAECLIREYVGCEQIEAGLLDWITKK